MRYRLATLFAALLGTLALSSGALGQADSQSTSSKAAAKSFVPDLSGVWMSHERGGSFTKEEPPMQPAFEAKFKATKREDDDFALSCFPVGIPRALIIPRPMEIFQTPTRVVMLFEHDHNLREIYIDGRPHLKDMELTWMGDSIGKWEGDTLVVDTTGLSHKAWIDLVGHPHSDALHLVERIRRVDRQTLEDDITFDDPQAYSKTWTAKRVFALRPTWRIEEDACEENNPRIKVPSE